MFEKILVALDGSPVSENALRVAVDEARVRNAELHALYVVHHLMTHTMLYEGSAELPGENTKAYQEIMENEAGKVLEHAVEVASEEGVGIITHSMAGDPRDVIIDFSGAIKADLVVIGSSGKSSLDRFLLGSVSSSVVEHSGITTMVVRK